LRCGVVASNVRRAADELVIVEQIRGFGLHDLQHLNGQLANLDLGEAAGRISMKCRSARALIETKIFVSVAFGNTLRAAWRASLRLWSCRVHP